MVGRSDSLKRLQGKATAYTEETGGRGGCGEGVYVKDWPGLVLTKEFKYRTGINRNLVIFELLRVILWRKRDKVREKVKMRYKQRTRMD